MDDIIKKLIASKIFKGKNSKKIIFSITIIYSIIALIIVFGTIFGSINNVDKVSGIFINIGIILFILSFVALMTEGDENQEIKELNIGNGINQIEEEKKYFYKFNNLHKKFIAFIYKNNGIYNKKQLIAIFEKSFNQNLDKHNTFNHLKTENGKWISSLRLIDLNNEKYEEYRKDKFNGENKEKKDIGPFITEDKDKKIIITEVGKKYVEENLIKK